jgi:hypothetical protein
VLLNAICYLQHNESNKVASRAVKATISKGAGGAGIANHKFVEQSATS